MRLLFRQRLFSWFDSYDIYDETGNTLFTVKGQLAWGHCLKIYDTSGYETGMLKEKIISMLPRFDIYIGGEKMGSISKRLSFFRPKFDMDFKGWSVKGDMFEWDYSIIADDGRPVAQVSKQLLHLRDTYVIDAFYPPDALCALMAVLAIDAEKCSRD